MGLFNKLATSAITGKSKNQQMGTIKTGGTADQGARSTSSSPLEDEKLESCAQAVAELYLKQVTKKISFDDFKDEARPYGEMINNSKQMATVAYRANHIAGKSGKDKDKVCIRYIEIAWDGIAGWRK